MSLPVELESELNAATRQRRGDYAEAAAGGVRIRQVEVDLIEGVEELGAELEARLLLSWKDLANVKSQLLSPGP